MDNEKLVNNIKQQLQKGISKDEIEKSLLGEGYTPLQIEEGFRVVDFYIPKNQGIHSAPKMSMKMLWLTIIFFLVVIVLCVGAYFLLQIALNPDLAAKIL